jgi:hypothetical protein
MAFINSAFSVDMNSAATARQAADLSSMLSPIANANWQKMNSKSTALFIIMSLRLENYPSYRAKGPGKATRREAISHLR